jgi:glycosyltransferase involved in cell wall biosynthesis
VPSLSLTLSLILPAYNEALRLPRYLDSVRRHLDANHPGRAEVIVVDDGSDDGLDRALEAQAAVWPALRLLRHETNRGKGAAVRTGMLAAVGELVLFADADGATPIEEEARLAEAIRRGADLAVGSRLVEGGAARRRRRRVRELAGRLFAAVARRAVGVAVRDTQCGFKMFRREAARRIFSELRETGYLFDLEVLALARRFGYETAEVPVDWTEIPGGHFHLVGSLPRVLVDLWRLRRRLRRGR